MKKRVALAVVVCFFIRNIFSQTALSKSSDRQLCSNIFLSLGLPETDEFWSSPPEPWTAVKVWNGQDVAPDHALDIKLNF
jgi:hypothetical protein